MRRLFAATVLVLLTAPPVLGQRFFGARRTGHAERIQWRTTPVGIVLQALVALILVVVTIQVLKWSRPGPYRRKGRRSFLENPEIPFPSPEVTPPKTD